MEYFEALLGRHKWFFTPKKLEAFWPDRCSLGEVLLCVVKIHFLAEQSLHKLSSVVGILKAFPPAEAQRWGMFRETQVQKYSPDGLILGTSLKRKAGRCGYSCVSLGKVALKMQKWSFHTPSIVHARQQQQMSVNKNVTMVPLPEITNEGEKK